MTKLKGVIKMDKSKGTCFQFYWKGNCKARYNTKKLKRLSEASTSKYVNI